MYGDAHPIDLCELAADGPLRLADRKINQYKGECETCERQVEVCGKRSAVNMPIVGRGWEVVYKITNAITSCFPSTRGLHPLHAINDEIHSMNRLTMGGPMLYEIN